VREVRGGAADPAALFDTGLEYSAPARGTWNIVHTGMLIPEAHEIFVCAQGCLRGVVLTAAEMGAEERFSTVAVRENNVTDGDLEELLIEGVTDILEKLPQLPPAVLYFQEYFEPAQSEADGEWLTPTAIFERLRRQAGSGLKATSVAAFGRYLKGMTELPTKRIAKGRLYLVKAKKA
jgi:hypothetical protein